MQISERMLMDLIQARLITPSLPAPNESIGVTFGHRKLAALVYDRVWTLPITDDQPPSTMKVYGATPAEIALQVIALLSHKDDELRRHIITANHHIMDHFGFGARAPSERHVSEILFRMRGITATPLYESSDQMSEQYGPGNRDVIVTTLRSLRVVDEGMLTWRQVDEFRRDEAARRALRRLTHWLDTSLLGKQKTFIADEIALRLDDYEAALKRHRIATALGVVESVIDPKFLTLATVATGAAYLAGEPAAAVATGLSITVGRVAISITRGLLEIDGAKRGPSSEVAFVHQVSKLERK